VLVGVQVSVIGLYLPPVFRSTVPLNPPQIISSLPVQTDLSLPRASGALVVLVAVQLSSAGSYLPPVFRPPGLEFPPPHIIISLPVHTALRVSRASGAFTVVVAVQVSSVQSVATEISGSLYFVLGVLTASRAAAVDTNPPTPLCPLSWLTSRSAKMGLARHSAITNGSLPSTSKSSRNISGSLV
jgi:hypothetical protein